MSFAGSYSPRAARQRIDARIDATTRSNPGNDQPMNLAEQWRLRYEQSQPARDSRTASAAASPPGAAHGAGQWHVLFGTDQPWFIPAAPYALQAHCVRVFARDPLQSLWARALLRLNGWLPQAGLLPGIESGLGLDELSSLGVACVAARIGMPGESQKLVALLFSEDGEMLGVAKLALRPGADALIAGEERWLDELAQIDELRAQVPQRLSSGQTIKGRRYLVTSAAPSVAHVPHDAPLAAPQAEFLSQLGRARIRTADFELSGCAQALQRALSETRRLLPAQAAALLDEAVRDCEDVLAQWSGPYVLAHGDFTPSHVSWSSHGVFVFDWERAHAEANPLEDWLHYLLRPRALAKRELEPGFLAALLERARGFARRSYPEWEWPRRVIDALALAYLLGETMQRLIDARGVASGDRALNRYWRLLERRDEWLS
jgi:hypothetical protein